MHSQERDIDPARRQLLLRVLAAVGAVSLPARLVEAAQALASTPFMSRRDLQARVAQLPDRYAREMAQQVFLEIPVLR